MMKIKSRNKSGRINLAVSATLEWAKRLQGIAQTGLTYAKDQHDIERYEIVQQIAAEMMAINSSDMSSTEFMDLFKKGIGYATPKVGIRAAVFSDNRLLLVRERNEGTWSLPGGFADIGLSPSMAVVREVREEAGYDVAVQKLAAVYDQHQKRHGHPPMPFHIYTLIFLCDILGGSAATSVETDAVSFFAEDCIPELSLRRVTNRQITHLFEHHRHPEWPTSLD